MSEAVRLFRALADETRLRILNLVAHREVCVCHLVQALGLGQSKVSRHLAHLRNAGLVNDRREGLWMYYSLAAPKGCLQQQMLGVLKRSAWELPMAAEDLQALEGLGECSDLCRDHSPNQEIEQCDCAPQ
jgi:ArsR family transcriptional regulator